MRSRTLIASAGALLLFAASLVEASHEHVHSHLQVLYRRHRAHRGLFSTAESGESGVELRSAPLKTPAQDVNIERRGGQCQFPTDAGLVPVTPGSQNAGWAMSPDQPCLPGTYCPYACPPGQVSMQWDPSATSYTYPQSMNGGLYCDKNGQISKPFPNQPYCQQGTGAVSATNNAGSVVSFCQTVLPGNEAMLIPTSVESSATLAVPDSSYWCGTAAHFYINPPGVTTDQACIWGSNNSPVGNWAPYVAGANTDGSGNTFVKLGWNPIYLEAATPFRNTMPDWGVKITCSGGNCNGLPCAIDPSQNRVNEMVGSSSNGAGGGAFCVVTVPIGATATFEVFQGSGESKSTWGPGQHSSKFSSSTEPSSWSSTSSAPPTSSSAWVSSASSSAWSAPAAFYATSANWTSTSPTTSSSSSTSYPRPSAIIPLFNENSTSTWAASSATLPKPAQSSTRSASGPAIATASRTGNASTNATTLKEVAVQVAAIVIAAFLLI